MEERIIQFLENSINLERQWGYIVERGMTIENNLLENCVKYEDIINEAMENKVVTVSGLKDVLHSYIEELRVFTDNAFNEDINKKFNELINNINIKLEGTNNIKEVLSCKEQLTILRDGIIKKIIN